MQMVETSYNINLRFEPIKLPPVSDILILGKSLPQGKNGVLHSFHLISPDVFELVEIENDDNVEAIIVNKSILAKLNKEKIVEVLREYVFPYITKGDSVRVDFDIEIYQKNIRGVLNGCQDVPTT